MKNLIRIASVYFVFTFGYFLSSAQAPPILWSRCYGGSYMDHCSDAVQTVDGGYILAGYTSSVDMDVTGNHGSEDFWLVKTDDNGYLQWEKCLGGTTEEEAFSVRQTSDGGYIVAGWTNSIDGDVTGLHGSVDLWVVKTDSTGNIQWEKTLGGSGEEGYYIGRIIVNQTPDGGYAVASSTNSNDQDVSGNHGDYDYWLVKLDGNGNIMWQRCFGGSDTDQLRDMRVTQDHGFILAGLCNSVDGDLTGYNNNFAASFFVKTDSLGVIQWRSSYYCIDTLTNCDGQMSVYSIMQLPFGDYLAAGTIYYYGYIYHYITNQLSSTGIVGGNQQYASYVDPYRNFCYSIQPTSDNGYILTGQTDDTEDDMFIYKTGSLGNWHFEWDTLSFEYQMAGTAFESADGGFVIAGTSDADSSCSPNYDPFQFRLIKLGGVLSAPDKTHYRSFTGYFQRDHLSMDIIFDDDDQVQIFLTDITGRLLMKTGNVVNPGSHHFDFNTENLAKGIYIVSLLGKKGAACLKVARE